MQPCGAVNNSHRCGPDGESSRFGKGLNDAGNYCGADGLRLIRQIVVPCQQIELLDMESNKYSTAMDRLHYDNAQSSRVRLTYQ
jgi:hypothetical protein